MGVLKIALSKTLRFEGGKKYTNHPDDPGKGTRYGVTERVARSYGYKGHMRYLPYKIAQAIYKNNYWNKSKAGKINDQRICNYLFDTSVNCGVSTASRMLQRAFNSISKNKITVDGKIGPNTLRAINKINSKVIFNSFVSERIKRYDKIIKNNNRDTKEKPNFVKATLLRIKQ